MLGDRTLIKDDKSKPLTLEDKYCEACRLRFKGEQDCAKCDRNIQVIENA